MIDQSKQKEIDEVKRLLENPGLKFSERSSLESYLKSLEKDGRQE